MIITIINTINWLILIYFILLSFGYILLLIASIPDLFIQFKQVEIGNIISLMKSSSLPPVTMIIPAYNEEKNILETINSIIKSQYPNIFIIVVNAGSTDHTLQKLIAAFNLEKVTPLIEQKIITLENLRAYYTSPTYKNITVLDKALKDRGDAFNMGVNACRTPLFITIDADSLIESDAVSLIAFQMLSQPNTVALGGAVYIINGCVFENGKIIEAKMSLNPIHAFQTCEYLRSFLFSRAGCNPLGGALCYSGTFTLFQLSAVVEVGGFAVHNLAQDFEIITRLQANKIAAKTPYQIRYTTAPTVWTEVPGTLKVYWRQRFNWQYYSLQSIVPYYKMLFNPKYKILGLFIYPFYLFGEILGVLVEFSAYFLLFTSWYLGILNTQMAILFFVICWGFTIFLTMATALMNFITYNKYRRIRDIGWIFFFSIIEIFGFRQFNVICRMAATCQFAVDKIKNVFRPLHRSNPG